jgi:hypothetical protein
VIYAEFPSSHEPFHQVYGCRKAQAGRKGRNGAKNQGE